MKRLSLFLALLMLGLPVEVLAFSRSDLKLTIEQREISSPAKGQVLAFSVARGGGGTVLLAWLESVSAKSDTGSDHHAALHFAILDSATLTWAAKSVLVPLVELPSGAQDSMLSLVSDGMRHVGLSWTALSAPRARNTQVFAIVSADSGASWSAPEVLSSGMGQASDSSLAWSESEGWHAVWLERESAGTSASWTPCQKKLGGSDCDRFTQVQVSPFAAPKLALFPDGSRLLLFRNFSPEASDPWCMRFWEGGWQSPQTLGREGWKLKTPRREVLRLAQVSPRVATTWFTAADDEPRILLSTSPDGGLRWTSASRVDLGQPIGNPDFVLLEDGTNLVSWLEEQGDDESMPAGLFLRRYAPNGSTVAPACVLKLNPKLITQGPGLAVLRGVQGPSAELVVAFLETRSAASALRIIALKLPTPTMLEELDRGCNCGPSTTTGFSIRAKVLSIAETRGCARISHAAVPGALRRGELEVFAEPAVLATLREGRSLLGHLEQKGGRWLLSDVRIYAD